MTDTPKRPGSKGLRLFDLIMWAGLAYFVVVLLPINVYGFSPGTFSVGDALPGQPAKVQFQRVIWRDVQMEYQVIGRQNGEVVCNAPSSKFTYRTTAKLPDDMDMTYWAETDPRCWALTEPGTVFWETCWETGWVLIFPPKVGCVEDHSQVLPPPVQIQIDPDVLTRGLKQLKK